MFWEKKNLGTEASEPFPNELRDLLAVYRDTLPDPDARADFMPGLWARIEARRGVTYGFGRLAKAFVTAGAALCILMSGWFILPDSSSPIRPISYVDALAADQADEFAVIELAQGKI